ncbi:MAG: site-specific DNA-methyltransferase, partial [Deltaproteobacteria bacterium]
RWTNMLVFGDNLQVLKTLLLMKQEGRLTNADGTPGVRLIYIDPPFASTQEFRGSQDQKAYQDKIAGAKFLEFLRKRLIFLRELLTSDGSMYVHLDARKGHYVKVLLDELMLENNFRNEIVWYYRKFQMRAMRVFANDSERILWYVKNSNSGYVYNPLTAPLEAPKYLKRKKWDKELARIVNVRDEQGKLIYDEYADEKLDDVWDVPFIGATSPERTGYPTQKPEALLKYVVKASSNPGDLVLDCFAGSGTTLAVAEKLDRRWIGIDCGKLAIYTVQKRLLSIAASKDLEANKKKYASPCRAFTVYNAGLYDYKMIKALPWEQYRDFALRLFQCRDQKHEISNIALDGYLGADSVMVFNYQEHKDALMDRGFVDDLHKYLGAKIGSRFFIIAPAASVMFLEDYIEKGKTKYFVLRIPYSIIEEIHNRGFTKIKQPVSETDVNATVDAVGFDFIQAPLVDCKYSIQAANGQLKLGKGTTAECVIKIEHFESKVLSRKPLQFANLETLSMVMLDYNFNGDVFDLDEVFYAESLKESAYE